MQPGNLLSKALNWHPKLGGNVGTLPCIALHVLLTVQELQCLVINIQDDSIKQREIRAFAFVESKQRPLADILGTAGVRIPQVNKNET